MHLKELIFGNKRAVLLQHVFTTGPTIMRHSLQSEEKQISLLMNNWWKLLAERVDLKWFVLDACAQNTLQGTNWFYKESCVLLKRTSGNVLFSSVFEEKQRDLTGCLNSSHYIHNKGWMEKKIHIYDWIWRQTEIYHTIWIIFVPECFGVFCVNMHVSVKIPEDVLYRNSHSGLHLLYSFLWHL